MNKTLKFLLSEYWLELATLAFGAVVLLGVLITINDSFRPYLPALLLIIGVTATIIGFMVVLSKASPERKEIILKRSVTVGWIIAAIILSPLLLPLGLYFLPSIIAWKRKHRNLLAIFVLNLCLSPVVGIGWVVALVWAFLNQTPTTPVIQNAPRNIIPL